LTSLLISNNNLTGPFPDLSRLSKLTYLYMNNNQFSGEIPDVFANWPSITSLCVVMLEFQLRGW
jgi:Leucine-rich repeat (LRR) protein